ncbi:hypothetical protein EHV15_13485 [Paenibacillus oralis]|uniref:Uncharacterized protein n=1 Tax=Paenibacillus oralis TaxID=2490856 RepID=A0A3P3U1U3_9BACL|nr:hypothetical protein [Paenibacillus oralis]RRJ63826.1 hypothetical protein EHV15_13485 [Paenibacillus oralis]
MRYFVKQGDIVIGRLVITETKLEYIPIRSALRHLPVLKVYPPGLFLYTFTNGVAAVDSTAKPTEEAILRWMEDRIFPKDRQDKDELLKAIGLDSYDVITLFLELKGKTSRDTLWITEDPDEPYSKGETASSLYDADDIDEFTATDELKNLKFLNELHIGETKTKSYSSEKREK